MSVRNSAVAVAMAAATFAATNAAAGDAEVIVESGADGCNAADFQKPAGRWSDSVAKSTATGLRATKSTFAAVDTTADAARFAPKLPVAGKYRVFVTYPKSGNAAGVIYRVVSKSGPKEIIQDQEGLSTTSTANSWIDLGVFDFDAGKAGYVDVCDPATGRKATEKEPNARVYADAVKFVPEGMALPADYTNAFAAAPQSALAAAAASASGGSSLPNLASAVTGAGAPSPGTPAGSGAASGLPSLANALAGAAQPSAAPAPAGGESIPSLPALASVPSAEPALPSLQAPAPVTMPSLGAAASAAPTPASSAAPAAATLPPLSAAVEPAPPAPASVGGSAMPPLSVAAAVTPSAPSLPPLSAASAPAVPDTGAPLPPLAGPVSSPDAPPSPSVTPKPGPEDGSITWDYDYSLALGAARASGRNVLVFVTAPRNKTGAAYENKFFKDPAVRAVMDKFVLVKVDFTRNSESAYGLRVYKPGAIAVTDSGGDRIGEPILSIPATPEDLVKQLEAFAAPAVKK